jgi:hypothetical protein
MWPRRAKLFLHTCALRILLVHIVFLLPPAIPSSTHLDHLPRCWQPPRLPTTPTERIRPPLTSSALAPVVYLACSTATPPPRTLPTNPSPLSYHAYCPHPGNQNLWLEESFNPNPPPLLPPHPLPTPNRPTRHLCRCLIHCSPPLLLPQ